MNVDDYMKLEYPYEVSPLPQDEGGGVYVRFPDFGAAAAHGDGATLQEALDEANEAKRLAIYFLIGDGQEVPLPGSSAAYSGRFSVRVRSSLHRKLAATAEQEGVSLNALINSALERMYG